MNWEKQKKQLRNGKYTITEMLNHSDNFITYKAEDREGNLFVVKTLSDRLLASPNREDFKNKLLAEGAKLSEFKNYSNIVKVEEFFLEDDTVCVVMEYVSGRNLAQISQDLPLPEKKALSYVCQIGQALAVVHARGVVHRDVKRENIVLTGTGDFAVLIDFDLARNFNHPLTTQAKPSAESEGFAAPEMCNSSEACDASTDIYSLAAILYYLLTKDRPVKAKDRAGSTDRFEIQLDHSNMSLYLKAAIRQGMKLNKSDRPSNMQEWFALLQVKKESPSSRLLAWWKNQDSRHKFLTIFLPLLLAILSLLFAFPDALENWDKLLNKFNIKQETRR